MTHLPATGERTYYISDKTGGYWVCKVMQKNMYSKHSPQAFLVKSVEYSRRHEDPWNPIRPVISTVSLHIDPDGVLHLVPSKDGGRCFGVGV